jgi:hypothetical protein
MRRKFILLILIACLLVANTALAMSSLNYRIDWMVPLSGGGSHASSTQYAVDLTIGQTASGAAQSTSYQGGFGFWYGIRETIWRLFLPLSSKP